MRWFVRVLVLIFILYAILTAYAAFKAATKHTPMPKQTYSVPAHWKFAAARAGHTFHAKGCGLFPRTVPPEEMVYGNSVREMQANAKEPCAYCVKETAN